MSVCILPPHGHREEIEERRSLFLSKPLNALSVAVAFILVGTLLLISEIAPVTDVLLCFTVPGILVMTVGIVVLARLNMKIVGVRKKGSQINPDCEAPMGENGDQGAWMDPDRPPEPLTMT